MYRTSPQGIRFIKEREGFEPKAYQDEAGVWTVGYGTTSGVFEGMEVDEAMAEKLLESELRTVETVLSHEVRVPISQHQFDALASLMYNIGIEAFRESTLLKVLNLMLWDQVPMQIRRWIYITKDGKKVESRGLKHRRELEARLFRNGYVNDTED